MMTQAAPGAILGILEACLYAEDLGRAAAFYADVLGLEVFARSENRHVFFRTGNGVFLLFNPAVTSEPGGQVPPHGARGPGHVAFAIRQADLDHWRARLADLGATTEAEVEWPGGGCSLYLRDPAGNSVELATPSIWGLPEEQTTPQAGSHP
jgi:catechol 2,3-dioxygenase-like lactoylglutathione lyase family enzyme